MWLLHFLPDSLLAFIVNTLLVLGVVGTVVSFVLMNTILKFFPIIANYYRIIQIASIVILTAGVYFKGGYSTEMLWREKVAELENKLKVAEQQSKEENVKVQEKIVYKDKIIKQKGETQIQYIDREVVKKEEIIKYVEQCPVPKVIIDEHNKAAAAVKEINEAAKGDKK